MIPMNSDHIYIGISFLRYASAPGICRTTVRSKILMKNESVREWGTGWLCASEMKSCRSEVEGAGGRCIIRTQEGCHAPAGRCHKDASRRIRQISDGCEAESRGRHLRAYKHKKCSTKEVMYLIVCYTRDNNWARSDVIED